jgi:hypothetical protein
VLVEPIAQVVVPTDEDPVAQEVWYAVEWAVISRELPAAERRRILRIAYAHSMRARIPPDPSGSTSDRDMMDRLFPEAPGLEPGWRIGEALESMRRLRGARGQTVPAPEPEN